jgi:hypothetical protein
MFPVRHSRRVDPGKWCQIHSHIQRNAVVGAAIAAHFEAQRGDFRAFVLAALT